MTDVIPLINEDGSFKNQKTNKAIDSRIESFLIGQGGNQNEVTVDVDGKFTIDTGYDVNVIDNADNLAVKPSITGDGYSTVLYFKTGNRLRQLDWEDIIQHGNAPISVDTPIL